MNTKFIQRIKSLQRQRLVTHRIPRYETLVKLIQSPNFRFNLFVTSFSSIYIWSLFKARKSDIEVVKMGASGSLTCLLVESTFYFIDALNTKSKVLPENISLNKMLKIVYESEGIKGLYKGFSAIFYSSIVAGYFYFFIYKGIKIYLKDTFEPTTAKANAIIYASASLLAECASMIIYYPYELIKVRLLTKNDNYQYRNVSDAIVKILRHESVTGLYKGIITYSLAYLGQYTIQMTVYELYIDNLKKRIGMAKFKDKEQIYIIKASVYSALVAALLTNCLECVVIRQQSGCNQSAREIFKEEGISLLTKGLGAKLMLSSLQSIIFFLSINEFGKIFNTNLSEDIE